MAAAVNPASPAVTPGMMRKGTLLAATPEDARIAALEPQYPLSGARERDETNRDVVLVGGRSAATLAGEFKPGLRARERQHTAINQRVVNDDVGLGEAGERVERQQPGIAGTGAGEPDMPRREHGGIGTRGHGGAAVVHGASPQP